MFRFFWKVVLRRTLCVEAQTVSSALLSLEWVSTWKMTFNLSLIVTIYCEWILIGLTQDHPKDGIITSQRESCTRWRWWGWVDASLKIFENISNLSAARIGFVCRPIKSELRLKAKCLVILNYSLICFVQVLNPTSHFICSINITHSLSFITLNAIPNRSGHVSIQLEERWSQIEILQLGRIFHSWFCKCCSFRVLFRRRRRRVWKT